MTEYIKRSAISEKEMQAKLEDIRKSIGSKMKTWSDRLHVSMYHKPNVKRFEGESWEEDGHTWTIKNGIRQTVSKIDNIRMPIWCPKCNKPMNHRFDRKFYYLRNHCFDCNVDWENTMRINGTWEEFEKRMLKENEKSYLKDKIEEHIDYMRTFKEPQLHFEDGRWETLASKNDFKELFETLENDIEIMLNRLDNINQEERIENDECEIIMG